MIGLKDFEKIDIRVGTIVESSFNDKSNKPSIILIIDFGTKIGLKKTSAQLTKNYNPDELIGKQIAAVINFPPKQIGKMISETLVLGFPDDKNEPILVLPSKKVDNGGKLF
jgi:tRNA-binding protein